MIADVQKFCIPSSATLRQAIECIDRNQKSIALIVDEERRLQGTLTDGDVRRALLDSVKLDTIVAEVLTCKASSSQHPITASPHHSRSELLEKMRKHLVRQIPIIDEQQRVVGLATLEDLFPSEVESLEAVIMAGGLGSRLRPLTDKTPKPMLNVGGRPLMERIVTQLRDAGILRMSVATHYMPEKIIEHFGDGRDFEVELQYISESIPLGTAGALSLMPPPQNPFLVINGDILTQVDFRAMLDYHREHHAEMTVAVRNVEYQIPYGVVETCSGQILSLREKPQFSYFVNAGIYLIDPSVYDLIPRNIHFNMTDLIQSLLKAERIVASFPIREYWLDIGKHEDYEQAQLDSQTLFSSLPVSLDQIQPVAS